MLQKKYFFLLIINLQLFAESLPLSPLTKSILVPGWGQVSLEKNKRARKFIYSEITLVLGGIGTHLMAINQINNYQSYSAKHAGVDTKNKNHKYWVDIGNYLSLESHNAEHLRWRQIDDIYDYDYDWNWESRKHMERFEEMRIRSDKLAKYGEYMIGTITLNHIISSINSLYLSKLSNRVQIYSFIEKKDINIHVKYDF